MFGKHNENSCFNSLFSVIYLKKIVTNLGNFTLNKEYRQFLQKQHLTSSSSKDTLGSFSRSDWPRLKMPHNSDNSWIQASQMLEHLNHSFGLFLKCLSFYLHVYVANSYIQQIHVVFFSSCHIIVKNMDYRPTLLIIVREFLRNNMLFRDFKYKHLFVYFLFKYMLWTYVFFFGQGHHSR